MMRRAAHAAAAGRPMKMPGLDGSPSTLLEPAPPFRVMRSPASDREPAPALRREPVAPAGGGEAAATGVVAPPAAAPAPAAAEAGAPPAAAKAPAAAGEAVVPPAAAKAPAPASEVARGLSIAVGLFIDGVPESLALGLTIAENELGVALLAGILVGNLVESYGAAQPIIAGGRSKRFAVLVLAGIGLALALATVLGGTVLADASPELIGTAQAVAAGAVLAVVSIAVIPHAFEEVSGLVAMATVLGFVSGYLLS
jgi:ZIP family zinc transporter